MPPCAGSGCGLYSHLDNLAVVANDSGADDSPKTYAHHDWFAVGVVSGFMPKFGVEVPLFPQPAFTDALVPENLLAKLISWQTAFGENYHSSDVAVIWSIRVQRLVCIRCRLSQDDRTEMKSTDAMMQHLDEHRAAGHRVADALYDDLLKERVWIDDEIRKTYAWCGRAGDGELSVFLMSTGRCLRCEGCKLNHDAPVECHTTDELFQHLDEHQTQGHSVPEHVHESLRRDRTENDQLIQTFFDRRGVRRPSAPDWLPETPRDAVRRRKALVQLSTIVQAAIARFEEPTLSSQRSIVRNGVGSDHVVEALSALAGMLRRKSGKTYPDFWLLNHLVAIFRDPDVPFIRNNQRREVLLSILQFIEDSVL